MQISIALHEARLVSLPMMQQVLTEPATFLYFVQKPKCHVDLDRSNVNVYGAQQGSVLPKWCESMTLPAHLCRGHGSERPVVGFCFSFPCQHVSLNSGKLIRWTKKFNNPGAVGQDPVRMLEDAFDRVDFPVSPSFLS